jgi:hypothetical protein
VAQFRSDSEAAAVLTVITRDYFTHGPGMGIKFVRFDHTGIPGATPARFSGKSAHGTGYEYEILFASGPYFYDEDIFTVGQALTQHKFVASIHSFYERVR